jgi:transposase-like protein
MSEFKWRHFEGEIILWAVRWYCRYGISYRDLEQMMGERGVPVDHHLPLGSAVRAGDRKATALAVASPSVDELAG